MNTDDIKKFYGEEMKATSSVEYESTFDFVQTSPCGRGERHIYGLVNKLWIINNPITVRVGNCFLNGRLKTGDAFLCVKHSGDCFQTYMFVEWCKHHKQLAGHPEWSFGSYGIGDSIESEIELTVRQINDLKEGKLIKYKGE